MPTKINTNDHHGEILSILFGSITSAGAAAFLLKAVVVPAIMAAVGGVVGFYVNYFLRKWHGKK